MTAPFIVKLWDITAADRSRNTLKAQIMDARDIGVSSYANEGGEMFFTIPWNHPQIDEIKPWERHYEVTRWNRNTLGYDVVGVGLLDDYDATKDEVLVYGRDYLSLFEASISGANTSHNDQLVGNIVKSELSAAIFQSAVTDKSVTRHIALGTIDLTSTSITVFTSLQSRLEFIGQVIDIYQSDTSARPIVSVTRAPPFTVNFDDNAGVDRTNLLWEFGGLINDFRYVPGFTTFATDGWAIGQKREGASVLTSNQGYASKVTYGIIQRGTLFIDIINQAALDNKTKRFARDIGTVGKNVAIGLMLGQVGPWEWGELGDSVPIRISRGLVDVDGLHTVWGQEWIGKADGSEDLFLSILPKET